MKLSISAELELEGTDFVTWLDVRAFSKSKELLGSARIALVHVGEIADAHGDIWAALSKTPLEPLHDLYFSQGWYNDDYAEGAGIDLLYVDRVDVEPAGEGRNLDLAIVRRLCDTLGSGCQLVSMKYRDASDAMHWARLGFTPSTRGRTAGVMHMQLGFRHARVVSTSTGAFAVMPTEGGVETLQNRRVGN